MMGASENALSTLRALFDSLPDLVVVYDENGRYEEVLTGHQVLSFSSRKELVGKTVADLLDEDPATTILDGIERTLATGDVQTIEYEIELAGQSFWFEARIAPIEPRDPKRSPDRVVFVARDVSQRRQQERTLQRQNERLEKFASIVSHDLRNPLNVATGRLELAREECDSDHLDAVERSHDRMRTMIDDLLAVAREGEMSTDDESVDLANIAENAWYNVDTGEATLRIETDAVIRADGSRLQQLLENLIRNSVEHGSTSSRWTPSHDDALKPEENGVTVNIGDLDGASGFYVEDDGLGIPDEVRETLFESGVSTSRKGAGFGLAIVAQIARTHDWEITVAESDAGGARFEFSGVEVVT